MASPSPKRKVEVRFCCCCAAVLLLQTLVPCCPPRHVSPNCHPAARAQSAQSSFSVREAALPRSGMSKKNTLYRALHDGRPVNSWC